jgi:hypothetical protein
MSIIGRGWTLPRGQVFLGLVFVIAGFIITWEGSKALIQLWKQFSPYLPFSLPADIGQKSQRAFPFIFVTFVRVMSSLCAVVIGLLWVVSGLAELLGNISDNYTATNLKTPELIPEALRIGEAQYWRKYFYPIKLLAEKWTRVSLLSPASYDFIKKILSSSLKIVLFGLVVFGIVTALKIIPKLVGKYLQISLTYYVPSFSSIYALFAFILIVNLIVIISRLPIKKKSFERNSTKLSVYGIGTKNLFFALFEEGCKLLNPKGFRDPSAMRLKTNTETPSFSSLIETYPESERTSLAISGYIYLPIILVCTVSGFLKLINFNRPTAEATIAEFIRVNLFDYLQDVFFAIGLIMVGLYFAEWARKFFDAKQFRSFLILVTESIQEISSNKGAVNWEKVDGVDPAYLNWAKSQNSKMTFSMEVFWASAITESTSAEANRYLVQLERSPSINAAMEKVLEIPFRVGFKTEPLSSKESNLLDVGKRRTIADDEEWTIE